MKKTLSKLFWVPNYFTIAIRKKRNPEDNVFFHHTFHAEIELPSHPDYWIADPMLAQDGEKTYLFYEACVRGKGRIECVELSDDMTVSPPTVVLEKTHHLSYPFVFSHDGCWYMIPESGSIGEVQLYKAVEFPFRWEYQQTLLQEKAVDTSVFPFGNSLLMVTFLVNGVTEDVTPKAYSLHIGAGEYSLRELCWEDYDSLRSRGAGSFFKAGNAVIRPAQLNDSHSYGNGLVFCEAHLCGDWYSESELFELRPDGITFRRYPFNGLHTYTATERYEAVDVRCAFFDFFKPAKKILSRLKRI